MPRYVISGDLLKSARVEVTASNLDEAYEKCAQGDFEVTEEYDDGEFTADDNPDAVMELPDED